MSLGLKLYEQLLEAENDEARARVLAEAFDALEDRYPHLRDVATNTALRESELRLQKEIKEVEGRLQKEIKALDMKIHEVEGRLQKEIKALDMKIHEVEGRLQKEIRALDVKIHEVESRLTVELEKVRGDIHRVAAAQTRLYLGGLALLGIIFKLADLLAA